jgi:hypothetical protein
MAVYHRSMKYTLILLAAPLCAQSIDQLEAHGAAISSVQYDGKQAVRLEARPNVPNGESYAVLKGKRFHNGTIEVLLAGKPAADAGPDARGFIGCAQLQDAGRLLGAHSCSYHQNPSRMAAAMGRCDQLPGALLWS